MWRQQEELGAAMLRRKPTRLELKMDDTEEFESIKKELEVCLSVCLSACVCLP